MLIKYKCLKCGNEFTNIEIFHESVRCICGGKVKKVKDAEVHAGG